MNQSRAKRSEIIAYCLFLYSTLDDFALEIDSDATREVDKLGTDLITHN
jgi:hypothetical protein